MSFTPTISGAMLMLTMSRLLSELLGAREPLFSQTIQELERASGGNGVDIRVANEINQKIKGKTRELGMDPADSTGQELYHSLQQLTAKHDAFLAQALGITEAQDILPRIKTKIDSLKLARSSWVLRHGVARRLVKATPPKKIMKQLGYRSVDSLLKREDIAELYAMLPVMESSQWQQRFLKGYKKLSPQDFETRSVELVLISAQKWGSTTQAFVSQKRTNVVHVRELGVIGLMPLPMTSLKGVTLTMLLFVLYFIEDIRSFSALVKLSQVKPNFADQLIHILGSPKHATFSMAGQELDWQSIQRYYGRLEAGKHPSIFEPHVQAEDLQWVAAEEVLYRIEPALKFWEGMEYSGLIASGGQVVSFNLLDNAVSYCNNLTYGQQAGQHLQVSLWRELLTRYLGQQQLEDTILKQLDTGQDDIEMDISAEGVFA